MSKYAVFSRSVSLDRRIFLPLQYYFNTEIMPKPENTEYPAFYKRYVDQVPDVKVLDLLRTQGAEIRALFSGFSEAKANFAYAEGKWSLKEMLGHMIDSERIFAYRALCMARGDQQPLPGMDQDEYVAGANFTSRSLQSLIEEYDSVRQATIVFFSNLSETDLQKTGIANGGNFTVNAWRYIISGHERHHMSVIKARYF